MIIIHYLELKIILTFWFVFFMEGHVYLDSYLKDQEAQALSLEDRKLRENFNLRLEAERSQGNGDRPWRASWGFLAGRGRKRSWQ